jgi:hypothetical protein
MIKKILNSIFGWGKKNKQPQTKVPEQSFIKRGFKFTECDSPLDAKPDTWYHLSKWKRPYYLHYNKIKTQDLGGYMKMEMTAREGDFGDWKLFRNGFGNGANQGKYAVAGVTYEDRMNTFILIGDAPDFKLYLERDPDNSYDPNAIKVMGIGTVQGQFISGQLGFLDKDTAKELRNVKEIDAIPFSVSLPVDGAFYELKIFILTK